jgi:hypothetical protein
MVQFEIGDRRERERDSEVAERRGLRRALGLFLKKDGDGGVGQSRGGVVERIEELS